MSLMRHDLDKPLIDLPDSPTQPTEFVCWGATGSGKASRAGRFAASAKGRRKPVPKGMDGLAVTAKPIASDDDEGPGAGR